MASTAYNFGPQGFSSTANTGASYGAPGMDPLLQRIIQSRLQAMDEDRAYMLRQRFLSDHPTNSLLGTPKVTQAPGPRTSHDANIPANTGLDGMQARYVDYPTGPGTIPGPAPAAKAGPGTAFAGYAPAGGPSSSSFSPGGADTASSNPQKSEQDDWVSRYYAKRAANNLFNPTLGGQR